MADPQAPFIAMLVMAAFPILFVTSFKLRLLNLAITPILAGLATGLLFQQRKGVALRRDAFVCAYLFAPSMAVVRLKWGQ